jgi:hypothetical protein
MIKLQKVVNTLKAIYYWKADWQHFANFVNSMLSHPLNTVHAVRYVWPSASHFAEPESF